MKPITVEDPGRLGYSLERLHKRLEQVRQQIHKGDYEEARTAEAYVIAAMTTLKQAEIILRDAAWAIRRSRAPLYDRRRRTGLP